MSSAPRPDPPLLVPPERVLPTLNADGSRRLIRPRQFDGRFLTRRRWVGWALIVLFAGLPFLRIGGKPAILLDIGAREFFLFGATFLATDGALLMLLMLSIFIAIFWITALFGRVWCGWGCPQTVYMELLFRPLERWLEGGRAAQKRLDAQGPNARRVLKYVVFALLSILLANIFLSYFVGVHRLATWMTSWPWHQPVGFAVVAVTAALVFADFAYFREQMCTVVCPYARLQSVLLDPGSLIIGYDARRGEPRGRGAGRGDCVDCGACVTTCPTGIDIREGLQLECIACAQCVDACDSVMRKFQRPIGLIRYASQQELSQEPERASQRASQRASRGRARLMVYPLLLAGALSGLILLGGRAQQVDVTLLRGIGAPFEVRDGHVHNQIRIKVQNRSRADANYRITLHGAPGASLIAPENPLSVSADQRRTTSVFIVAPAELLPAGRLDIELQLDDGERSVRVPYRLLGPQRPGLQPRGAEPLGRPATSTSPTVPARHPSPQDLP